MSEPLELAGRRALVTGAGSGIGLATARLLHQRGAQVAGVVHHTEPLRALGVLA